MPMRALVVDDSPGMRTMIKGHLSRLGWTVVGEAENGVEALEMVRSLNPDLMTLDIIMPEMDGIECYRQIRQLASPPRTLIISVLAAEPRIISAYEAEIVSTHFLKKPFSEKELKDKIEHVMANAAMPIPVIRNLGESANDVPPPPAPGPTVPPLPNN